MNNASKLHPRNPHQGRYDLAALCRTTPALKPFITTNPRGEPTIDFANADAVLCLNQALLAHYYHVKLWQIPKDYLCPPIPGRADYIHNLADLLGETNNKTRVLDIGTGANCIYPIIGSQSYGWQFTASDIDPLSVKTARMIVAANPCLTNKITVVQQKDSRCIFAGIIKPTDTFAATMCNPPFHASPEAAKAGTQRKWKNLNKGQLNTLNFGGQNAELWCDGGEIRFLTQMINESVAFKTQVGWFTTLVSKGDNLKHLQAQLKKVGAKQVRVINMAQGQKVSRVLAWSWGG